MLGVLRLYWRNEVLGWKENTLTVHISEFYEEFDNLVTVSLYKFVIKPL